MIRLEINGDEWGLDSNSYCWKIGEFSGEGEKEVFLARKYFTSLERALNQLLEMSVRKSDYQSFGELCDLIKQAKQEIISSIPQDLFDVELETTTRR